MLIPKQYILDFHPTSKTSSMVPPYVQPTKSQPSSLTCLPFDVLNLEILPRLPVKSLLRFKTVCKSFKTVISSSYFAYLHLHMCNASENHYVVVIKDNNNFNYFSLHSLSTPSATFLLQPSNRVHIYSNVHGSCNGLLLVKSSHAVKVLYPSTGTYIDVSLDGTHVVASNCLIVKSSHTVKLLNPSTRTYIDVSLDGTHAAACNCDGHSTLGFGFDFRTNDYKIVKVCPTCSSKTTAPKRRITFVYSVNSKAWTFVDDKCPSDYSHFLSTGDGVLINDHLLHWMLHPRVGPPSENNRIGCFDIYTEKWADDVLLPDSYYNRSPPGSVVGVNSFGVFEGGMYAMLENCKDSHYEMWVMKEYGVQESWVKLFRVPFDMVPPCSRLVPIAYRGQHSNMVLIWQQRHYHASTMKWYNVRDNNYVCEGYDPHFGNSQPYRCNGSLVTLPDAKPILG